MISPEALMVIRENQIKKSTEEWIKAKKKKEFKNNLIHKNNCILFKNNKENKGFELKVIKDYTVYER